MFGQMLEKLVAARLAPAPTVSNADLIADLYASN